MTQAGDGVAAVRGRVLSFHADPSTNAAASFRLLADGLVVVQDGVVRSVGEASALLPTLPRGTPADHWPDCLILPGFIDAHVHYPQTRVIASYGAQLLDWLNRYTFPQEARLSDAGIATALARFFLDELLRNGTTTAAVYCSVHPQSVEAFFAESERRNTRMIAGKVMMDRNAPDDLRDSAAGGARETEALVQRWHARGRQHYAITPRFALTSSAA